MLPLIFLTFAVFVTLWFGDFYLTMKTTKRIGPTVELNPIMRSFLQLRGRYVWGFKIIELGLFLYLIYFLTSFIDVLPFYILLGYIIFYGILIANNSKVYYDITGEQTSAINYIFIAIIIFITLFIYLNSLLYFDLTLSYSTLMQCHSSFNDLYWTCQQQNATGGITLPRELEDILKSLNLTITKPW